MFSKLKKKNRWNYEHVGETKTRKNGIGMKKKFYVIRIQLSQFQIHTFIMTAFFLFWCTMLRRKIWDETSLHQQIIVVPLLSIISNKIHVYIRH